MMAVSLLLMLTLDSRLFLLVAGVGMLYLMAAVLFLPRLYQLAAQELRCGIEQNTRLIEIFQGITTLRTLGDGNMGMHRWLPPFFAEISANFRQERLNALVLMVLDFFRLVGLATLVWWGTKAILANTISLGTLLAFYGIATSFFLSLHILMGRLVVFARAWVHAFALQ
jgi:ATP-binding cassette subfamily B protein RaxB